MLIQITLINTLESLVQVQPFHIAIYHDDFIDKCNDGDVRLSASGYSTLGRVDVCINGIWGTICSNSFDVNDASVVCTHLGYIHYGQLYQYFPLLM